MSITTTLLADIGATFVRFALSKNNHLNSVQVLKCDQYPSPIEAINYYLDCNETLHVDNICFAVAGPVLGDVVKVTNNHWVLDANYLKDTYNLKSAIFINDFEAIAYSIPILSNKQIVQINGNKINNKFDDDFNYVVLGPGSGLGVAALLKRRNNIFSVVTEAGHINFSPINDLQIAIFNYLKKSNKHVTNEHLLSGPGILNIYQSLCEIEGIQQNFLTAQEICESAIREDDEISKMSLNVFFEILGQVSGDLALAYNAYNGVYIGGGIIRRYSSLLIKSQLCTAFTNKNQHQDLLANTPLYLIAEEYPGLIGANYFINKNLV